MKKIFHISDIHIRNGDKNFSRYNEYNGVFERLFANILSYIEMNCLKFNEYIIVISGDVFHNKNVIGNYGLQLYKKLIKGLTDIGRTVLFHGNHDRCQSDKLQPSLLSSTFDIENLILLRESGGFVIDDVGFSYISVDDTLDSYKNSGRIENLPKFPETRENVKYKVALFHGTFANVKMNYTTESKSYMNPYPFEWIKEYDYAILGDIHLRQYGEYGKTLWGYAGSLIQQNYGEDIIEHGYMIWDLERRIIEEVNIKNEIGYVNMKEEDSKILIRYRGRYQEVEEIMKGYEGCEGSVLPNRLEVKIFSEICIDDVLGLFNRYGIEIEIVNRLYNRESISDNNRLISKEGIDDDSMDIIGIDEMLRYFERHITKDQLRILEEILREPERLLIESNEYPDDLNEECKKKNKEISTYCVKNNKRSDESECLNEYTIEYVEWENMYCYEGVNWIDLSETVGDIFLVSGENGIGKSAIYDIITLSIWGEVSSSKTSSITGSIANSVGDVGTGYINYRHDRGSTKIVVRIGKDKYRIVREYTRGVGKRRVNLYKEVVRDTKVGWELLKKDSAAGEMIRALIGTIDEFLSSSMITQNVDYDILKMNYKDCVYTIDKATKIENLYNLYDMFKCSANKYKDFRKTVEAKREVYERMLIKSRKEYIDEETYNRYVINLDRLEKEQDVLEGENNRIMIDVSDRENLEIMNCETLVYHEDVENDCIIENEGYEELKEKYKDLKKYFKNVEYRTIVLYAEYEDRKKTIDKHIEPKDKPCEYDELIRLLDKISNKASDIIILREDEWYIKRLERLYAEYKEVRGEMYGITREYVIDEMNLENIQSVFGGDIEQSVIRLKEYCKENERIGKSKSCETRDSKSCETREKYLETLKDLFRYDNILEDLTKSLEKIDKESNDILQKQNEILRKPIPSFYNTPKMYEEIIEYFENIRNKDTSLIEYEKRIKENEKRLNEFYKKAEEIVVLENEYKKYTDEYTMLTTKDEYQYNPECQYCCNRSWVCRIRELKITMKYYERKLDELNEDVYLNTDIEYLVLYNSNENDKENEKEYRENKELLDYYIIENEYNVLRDSMNKLLEMKRSIIRDIENTRNNLKDCEESIISFNIISYELYDRYQYNKLKKIENEIELIENYLRYLKLKREYAEWEEWEEYNYGVRIEKAKEYVRTKEIIERYEHNRRVKIRDEMLRKIAICKRMRENSKKIREMMDDISKYKINEGYNREINENSKRLKIISRKISDRIAIMEIIINNFKDFKKELYKTVILKRLIERTNRYIESICHDNTKRFCVDYIINDVKDILHINWLIKNKDGDSDKRQTISINQASGFQRFVISLCLRMSLYSSMKGCRQIFIDEGFVAFDKQNMSIVPIFLKGLLKKYDSIILVSHIEMIRENVDKRIDIEYDKSSNKSIIRYGERIHE